MPDFKIVDVSETPYLYVERSCSMDPSDISKEMGAAFKEVWQHMEAGAIKPAGPALSVYYSYDPQVMNFRAGFTVAHEDMSKIEGNVKADVIPHGRTLHFTHKGSYATLRNDYALMMEYLKDSNLEMRIPTWELYVNDPGQTPEAGLITECYTALA